MKINLTKAQYHFLKNELNVSIDVNSFKKKDIENILDQLSDSLAKKGLNNDDEPNSFGLIIEEIIDVLNRGLYS